LIGGDASFIAALETCADLTLVLAAAFGRFLAHRIARPLVVGYIGGRDRRSFYGTSDWREAKRLGRERLERLEGRSTVPTANSRT
jgi:hypothetical protein